MIDYKELSNFLLNHLVETYSQNDIIALLLRFEYKVDDLLELGFDIDLIEHEVQLLIDDYNTTK